MTAVNYCKNNICCRVISITLRLQSCVGRNWHIHCLHHLCPICFSPSKGKTPTRGDFLADALPCLIILLTWLGLVWQVEEQNCHKGKRELGTKQQLLGQAGHWRLYFQMQCFPDIHKTDNGMLGSAATFVADCYPGIHCLTACNLCNCKQTTRSLRLDIQGMGTNWTAQFLRYIQMGIPLELSIPICGICQAQAGTTLLAECLCSITLSVSSSKLGQGSVCVASLLQEQKDRDNTVNTSKIIYAFLQKQVCLFLG